MRCTKLYILKPTAAHANKGGLNRLVNQNLKFEIKLTLKFNPQKIIHMIDKSSGPVNTDSLKFAAFIYEGMNYVDAVTPTRINSGGCGVFAKLLSEELTEHGIPHKIVAIFLKGSEPWKRSLENFLKTGNADDQTCASHILVSIADTIYVDANGIANGGVLVAKSTIELTKAQLDDLVEKGSWNPIFDKSCTPQIKEKLDMVFDHLNDFHPGIFQYPKDGVRLTPNTIRELKKESIFKMFAH